MKTKASILSFQFADNYGAVLQIYALKKILESMDLSVDVIDFIPEELSSPYSVNINYKYYIKTKGLKTTINATLGKLLNYKKNSFRKKNFNLFRKEYLSLTNKQYRTSGELHNDKLLKNYDFYFVGSDQVWNPDFFEHTGDSYFLGFANPNSIKIAYAASIAKTLSEVEKNFFEINLKNIDSISVRELSAKEELEQLTDQKVEVTLDPTLLHDKSFWNELIKDNVKNTEDFILVYDLVKDERTTKLSNHLAKTLNAKIISFSGPDNFDPKYWKSSFAGEHPSTMLELIDKSKFVVTSSFHGTAFSIIFKKNFYSITHPTRGSRMIDFLKMLQLEERLIYDVEEIPNFDSNLINVDYSIADQILIEKQSKAIDFIKESIMLNKKEE